MDYRLGQLQQKAKTDPALLQDLLETRQNSDPLTALSSLAKQHGVDISAEELATLGEESTAAMLRSQNGGGEYEPYGGWGDEYELFFLSLENLR